MRGFWVRIGIGAGVVFAAGMFFVSLARQVKTAAADALRSGRRVTVPLSILPFEINGRRVGTVREIHVEKAGPSRLKQIRVQVRLKGFDPDALEDCALLVGPRRGHGSHLFDCVNLSDAEAEGLVKIGEVRFEPGGVTRAIVIDKQEAREWFADADPAEVQLQANVNGANLEVQGQDGEARFQLVADSDGVLLHARDERGREVVKIQAGASGVDIKVEGKRQRP